MVNQKLTQKQEGFCLNIVQGMPQRDAYINAGYSSNQKSSSIDENACVLAARIKIISRIEELRQPQANSTKMLVAEREERLSEIGREDIISAKGTPLRGPNITAIRELNQMDGVYPPEKHAFLGAIDLVVRYIDKGE